MEKTSKKIGRPRKTKNDKVDKKIIRDLKKRKDKNQIAKELGVTRSAVTDRIRRMKARGVEVIEYVEKKEGIKKTKSDEIDNTILTYLKEGESQNKIAKKIGLSKQSVSQRIKRMRERGEEVPNRYDRNNYNRYDELYRIILEKLKENQTQKEVGAELGYSIYFIQNRIREMKELGIKIPKAPTGRPRKPYNIDLEEKIRGFLAERKTQMEMANELGVSQCYISKTIKSMRERGIEIPEQKVGRRKQQASAKDMDKEVLAEMIVNLMKVKGATEEQVKTMGEYYGVDVENALKALELKGEER